MLTSAEEVGSLDFSPFSTKRRKQRIEIKRASLCSAKVHLTPDSSPELTKKSWFGSLMTTEKDETFTILVKGKALASVKADLIHAFLSVSLHRNVVRSCTLFTRAHVKDKFRSTDSGVVSQRKLADVLQSGIQKGKYGAGNVPKTSSFSSGH